MNQYLWIYALFHKDCPVYIMIFIAIYPIRWVIMLMIFESFLSVTQVVVFIVSQFLNSVL